MDDEDYLAYESEGDYGFFSEDEEEGSSAALTDHPYGEDVILQVGSWRKGVRLQDHRGGLIQDWYAEYGSPGATLDLGDKMLFVKEKWYLLERLMEWEALGPSLFEPDVKTHKSLPATLYYHDVSPIARSIGTRMEGWELYTIIDRRMNQKERMDLYRSVGRLMGTYDICMRAMDLSSYLVSALDDAASAIALNMTGDIVELTNIVEGMKHNARLRAMSYDSTQDNRLVDSGVKNNVDVREKINWAYIDWEDVAYLFTAFDAGAGRVTPTVLFLAGDMRQVNPSSIVTSILPGGMRATEYALPVLYAMRMDSLIVYVSSGLSALSAGLSTRVCMKMVNNERLSVETLSYYITQGAILAPSSNTWARTIVLDVAYVEATVRYVISTLGWFAAQVIHKLLSRSQKVLGPFGSLFLAELDKRLTPMLDLIAHYRSMSLMAVAENDVAGMLLSALPSPSHAAQVEKTYQASLLP